MAILLRSYLPPRGVGSSARPLFSLFKSGFAPGIDSLDSSLTINSISVTPEFRYKGGDADGTDITPWVYGSTLVAQGTGGAYNQGSPLFGTNDDSFCGAGSRYYEATSAGAVGDLGTDDFVFEFVFKQVATTGSRRILSKFDYGASSAGYWFQHATGLALIASFRDGANSLDLTTGDILKKGSWYHVMVFMNRNENSTNGASLFVNGVQITTGNPSALGNLDSIDELALGAESNGGEIHDGCIAYAAMWQQADWHQAGADGPVEWAIIAKERFARLTGMYANAANPVPSVATRSTSAYLDKNVAGVRKLYNVGANWMRTVERLDSASASIRGYLAEPAATNLCLQSQDIDTTWTKIDDGDAIGGSVVVPNESTSVTAGIIADSTDGQHGVTQDITLTAATYTFSCFAKAGDQDWLYLIDTTSGDGSYFNLASPAVGTAQGGAVRTIEDWGNGWCRCSIETAGTVAAHTFEVSPAAADTDNTIVGDGAAVNTYIWGIQCELGNLATSYIPTTTAAVARTADILGYTFVGPDKGTVLSTILFPNYINADYPFIFDLNDTTNRIRSYLTPTTGVVGFVVGGTATIAGTTDLSNGAIHELRCFFSPALSRLYIDGTKEGDDDTDTTVTAITNLKVGIDMANTAGRQLNGVISGISVLKKLVSP
jgi:hypothetical protein